MENKYRIYEDIAVRTRGDIYMGVVGPVRTGKSTFIKKFMDLLVIPNIENQYDRERTVDESPQSATGRTIMTTEPKFVPNEAVTVQIDNNASFKVRLVDCVGYLVDSALGYMEDDIPRMVSTPWFEHQIPFEEAAEIGTKKVINEHSTIGIVVTADGSFTQISRDEYEKAEEKVIDELDKINKPYIIILNSAQPESQEVIELAEELKNKYDKPVIPMDCLHMNIKEINQLMQVLLYEFPVCEINVDVPKWTQVLDDEHWLKQYIMNSLKESFPDNANIRQIIDGMDEFKKYDFIKKASIGNMELGYGKIKVEILLAEGLFYKVLNDETGMEIKGEDDLFSVLKELSVMRKEYKKIEFALHEVKTKGYGVVTPSIDELRLEKPEIIKQGMRFGVRLRASAPSIHMIRADIETEIAPLVGSEKQSEELVDYLLEEFEGEPEKLWESNIFGKSLHDLISEGLQNKLFKMPEDAQLKLQETLQRIINEGSGGLICIIL